MQHRCALARRTVKGRLGALLQAETWALLGILFLSLSAIAACSIPALPLSREPAVAARTAEDAVHRSDPHHSRFLASDAGGKTVTNGLEQSPPLPVTGTEPVPPLGAAAHQPVARRLDRPLVPDPTSRGPPRSAAA